MKYLVFLVMLFSSIARAEVTELSLEAGRLKDARLPYFPGKQDFQNYVGLNWGLQGYKILYLDSTAFFYGDEAQVRYVGLHFTSGFHLTENISVFYKHKSEHAVDEAKNDPMYPNRGKFPIENSFGFKLDFIPRK